MNDKKERIKQENQEKEIKEGKINLKMEECKRKLIQVPETKKTTKGE